MSKPNTGEYCLEILKGEKQDVENNSDNIKKKIINKYSTFFQDIEPPFIIAISAAQKKVCIKLLKKTKKVVEKIEEANESLSKGLKINNDIQLGPPKLFNLEQYSWWTGETKFGEKKKWNTLEHHGPYFPDLEKYNPHRAPLIYDGKEYVLTPTEEKVANFYARRLISEENPNITIKHSKDQVFKKNFWTDFRTFLTKEHRAIFKNINNANFTKIVEKLKDIKASETETEKLLKKEETARKKYEYGYATVNGVKEAVGNYTIEPSGIFLGRGKNPQRGKIKREILPKDVIINIGESTKVPKAPKGHSWGGVIHNHNLAWLASWKDPISGENKYIYFSAEGQLKGKSDLYKYEKARKLSKYIEDVRELYSRDINNNSGGLLDYKNRQLGTVLYLIDHFGFRVGGDKDDDEADTVGASTLRVEHITIPDSTNIVFDFLGKDSIRFYKKILVPERIVENVSQFMKGKAKSTMLFDKINAQEINSYLKSFDKYFTAKVFRTRLASVTMYEELKKIKIKSTDKDVDKKVKLDKANAKVAELLNHKRTVPIKTQEKIKELKAELKELQKELKQAKDEGKKTATIEKKIATRKRQVETKSDTLSVAINTSKTNYIDPRIIVSWSKKYEVPINKTYTPTMQKKFSWAINTINSDWDYFHTPLLGDMDKLEPIDPDKAKSFKSRDKPEKSKVQPAKAQKNKPEKSKVDVNLEAIKDFYINDKPSPNQGYTLKEILSWSDKKLEDTHDYIQTLFPLKTFGVAKSFLLTDSAIQFFKKDDLVRYNVYLAYSRMMEFYGYRVDVEKKSIEIYRDREINNSYLFIEHNYKRITRMLQFLYSTNFKLLAYAMLSCICEDMKDSVKLKEKVKKTGSLEHWINALRISRKDYAMPKKVDSESDKKRLLTAILSLSGGKSLDKDATLYIGKSVVNFSKYLTGLMAKNNVKNIDDAIRIITENLDDSKYVISEGMKMSEKSIEKVLEKKEYFPYGIILKDMKDSGISEIPEEKLSLFLLGVVDFLLTELTDKVQTVSSTKVSKKDIENSLDDTLRDMISR